MGIEDYLTDLSARGIATFNKEEITQVLQKSPIAIQNAIWRQKRKHIIAEPVRGFYLNIKPEYRILGCLPADHFIHDLMTHLQLPYYVGLLSAAEYHGASHHKPQQLQVMIPKKRRPIMCGKVGITFVTKKDVAQTPTQEFTSQQSSLLVSTAEVTAMDLVTYPHRCGGIDNVYMVLSELIEKIKPEDLMQLTNRTVHSMTWIQRLGFLLDSLQAPHLSELLLSALKKHRVQKISLVDSTYQKDAPYNKKWKLIINAQLELEL